MSIRPFATGMVSFGLVTIPVKLYSTGEAASGVQLNMLHKKCGSRLKQQYVCPVDDEVVGRDEMVKGYEYAKGQYVLFSDEELKALNREATNAISIAEFVPLSQVDPIYFEKSYYLGPDKGGERPYRLLAEAMKQTSRAALARYAARGKDYLVLLRPFEEGLVMQQLRYYDELRPFSEVPVGPAEVREPELKLAKQIIDQISSERFEPTTYEDEVRKQTLELIEKKVSGQEISAAPTEAPKAQIIDLMAALKASLGAAANTAAATKSTAAPQAAAPAGRARSGRTASTAAASEAMPAAAPAAARKLTAVRNTPQAAPPVTPVKAKRGAAAANAAAPAPAADLATPLAGRKPPKASPRTTLRAAEETASPQSKRKGSKR